MRIKNKHLEFRVIEPDSNWQQTVTLLDQNPVLFETRDIGYYAFDNLYFARGQRPRTIGITAT